MKPSLAFAYIAKYEFFIRRRINLGADTTVLYWHILNSFAVPSEELKCLMKFTDKSDSAKGFNSGPRKIDIGYRGCSILARDYVTSSFFLRRRSCWFYQKRGKKVFTLETSNKTLKNFLPNPQWDFGDWVNSNNNAGQRFPFSYSPPFGHEDIMLSPPKLICASN